MLNLPAVTIRNAHERPEGMDVGALNYGRLEERTSDGCDSRIVAQHDRTKRVMRPISDYEAGPVSKQILRVVLSYTDYINRTVW